MKYLAPFLVLIIIMIVACNHSTENNSTKDKENKAQFTSAKSAEGTSALQLGEYWYQGEAEITRYELQQNRYRDVHPGEAILVQVTEDFLTGEQVKNDNYTNPNSTNVLKTNMIRRFTTGLYDYSMMTSVFTPANAEKFPKTLKVTMSSQDWCGHSFMQLNWRDNQYQTQIRSYFESEGDENFAVPYAMLEDEIFNRIRINPQALPTGKIKMLPSLAIVRLLHKDFEPLEVEATLGSYTNNDFKGSNLKIYTVKFPKLNRTLEIVFEAEAPYQIPGWRDSYPGFDGQIRATVAKRTETIKSPYWQKNALADMKLRKNLGVEGL